MKKELKLELMNQASKNRMLPHDEVEELISDKILNDELVNDDKYWDSLSMIQKIAEQDGEEEADYYMLAALQLAEERLANK